MSTATGKQARTLGRVWVGLFAISTAFPLIAGGIPSVQKYRWLGVADGVIALALVVTAMAVASRTRLVVSDRDRLAALKVTRAVVNVIPVLLLAFFLAGTRIDWTVLVIGLAWRGWLLIYTLPFLAAALSEQAAS